MEKRRSVTISPSILEALLIEKGFITEGDHILGISLTDYNLGIVVNIMPLNELGIWSKKQKTFMNTLVKDMGVTAELIEVIREFAYNLSTESKRNLFDSLQGSDLFNSIARKESYWLKLSGSSNKTIQELNELFKSYNLPTLEKE